MVLCFHVVRKQASINCCGLVKGYFLGLISFFLLQLLVVIAVDKNTLAVIVGQFVGEEGTLVIKELIVSVHKIIG